jgi:flagellar biosynthetic protein FliR
VRALADSLHLCPPESFAVQKNWAEALIRFSGSIFGIGLRLAAPVVALLMLTDAALAVLGRVQTQIQLVSLTIPVKLAVSMLLLSATLIFQPRVFGSVMTQGIRLIEGMLRSGH